MGRKKKKLPLNLPDVEARDHQFDLDAIILMANVGYVIRKMMEEISVGHAKDKQCVTRAEVELAVREMGLGASLELIGKDVGDEDEEPNIKSETTILP